MSPHSTKTVSTKKWIVGDKFEKRMPHHDGIKALWETKWKLPCMKSVYPFHDGNFEDFEPVFEHLIANDINDGYGDAYTEAFFSVAEELTKKGDAVKSSNDLIQASELYLRAACIYRISRFPYITSFPEINSVSKWKAWEAQKEVYMKAASSWSAPVKEVLIPHTAREGVDRATIPIYVRLPPKTATTEGSKKFPVVLLITGLDGYRPDNTQRTEEFLTRGWASVIAEIPGTADSPADPSDPKSSDRLWTSILDWMESEGSFDMSRVLVWGLSCGGYCAARVAHTHRDRLRGSVAQGAGIHFFFGKDWIERAEGHEYPFSIWPALSTKHGYATPEEFSEDAQKKFSLLETGILQKASTRLLLINGVDDGLMPIEDSMLLFEHGTPKEARFFSNSLHMGYPLANGSVYPWMESVMA